VRMWSNRAPLEVHFLGGDPAHLGHDRSFTVNVTNPGSAPASVRIRLFVDGEYLSSDVGTTKTTPGARLTDFRITLEAALWRLVEHGAGLAVRVEYGMWYWRTAVVERGESARSSDRCRAGYHRGMHRTRSCGVSGTPDPHT